MPKRKRSHQAFVGDRIVCLYLLLSCCCLPLWADKPAGQEPEWPVNESLRQFLLDLFDRPNAELVFGTAVIGLIIGWFWLLFDLWRSRMWALWALLVLNLPGVVFSLWANDGVTAFAGGVIVVYCALRLARLVG